MIMKYYWFIFITCLLKVHNANSCGSACLKCNNDKTCSQCIKGAYSDEQTSTCHEVCPDNLVADNMSMTCKDPSEDPVYIKAYTTSRCLNSCGREFEDCSCKADCKLKGTCCSDFKFCEIIAKNNKVAKSSSKCELKSMDGKMCLQCKPDYYYYNRDCFDTCPPGTEPLNVNKICIKNKSKIFR
jgi:hypothetical protein